MPTHATDTANPVKARINCGVAFNAGQGYGGYSAMIRVGESQLPTVAGAIEDSATFIRCSMMAAAEGLEALNQEGLEVDIVTPSTYFAEHCSDRAKLKEWRDAGWMQENGDAVVHSDLWDRILDSLQRHATLNVILASDIAPTARPRGEGNNGGSQASESNVQDAASTLDKPTRAPDCEISYSVATIGNSGIGAYVISFDYPGVRKELSSKFQVTNYGRMQLIACLDALEAVRKELGKDGLHIILNTPDEFTEKAVNRGWLDTWSQNDWKRREGDRVRNSDLWQVFRRRALRHDVEVRLAMDDGRSEKLANQAQIIARREQTKLESDAGFKQQEEEDVAAGRTVLLYTDGSALENPGPGGWAAVMHYKGRQRARSQGYVRTTNNRMELMGPSVALEQLVELVSQKKLALETKVIVITDSEYLVSAMVKGWAKKWRKNAWTKQNGEKAANIDLWKRILKCNDRLKSIEFRWVRGHSNNSENNRCDAMAREAAKQPEEKLLVDQEYQKKR